MNESIVKLAKFGAWCTRQTRDHLGEIDGGAAQDEMLRIGVLVEVEAKEPCGESCRCVDYDSFPQPCYRYPADIAETMRGIDN